MSEVFPVSNHAISEHECSVILVNMLRGQDHRQAPEEEQDEVMQEGSVVVEIPVMKSVTQSHLAKCQRAASELAQNLDLSESVEGLAVNYARHCEEPAIYSRHPNTIAAASKTVDSSGACVGTVREVSLAGAIGSQHPASFKNSS